MISEGRAGHERSRFVEDLLSYMTLEEKLGQLDLYHAPDDPALEQAIAAGHVGGVAGTHLPNRLQELATGRSRLGIPLLLTQHTVDLGLSPWALAASWDEGLMHAMGASTAHDSIGGGFNCIHAPRAALADAGDHAVAHIAASEPHLATRLATAFARGAAESQDQRGAVLAVPTLHSMADDGGLAWSIGLVHAEGVAAIDSSALDRETSQRIGFDGILVSECRRIAAILGQHYRETSARSAIESAERSVADGLVSEQEIDLAVRGVLAAKHGLGLFRDPRRIIAPPASDCGYARDDERARATFVLLRNEAGLLPLSPVSDRVLVIGGPEGAGAACAEALNRAGIGHAMAPGLAQRRAGESWAAPVPGDHFALSLICDAARRADFALVVLENQHFVPTGERTWRRPTPAVLAMLRGLAVTSTRLVAILATAEPVDLADADQHFAAVLQCWQPTAGLDEALCDVLSGRFSPQGRMPASAGRYVSGHGLGLGESVIGGYTLSAPQGCVIATVRVRNSGSFAMRETVQAYVRCDGGQLRLVAFAHAMLAPGEDVPVSLELGLEALGTPGASGRLELAPGHYEILVGKNIGRLLSATIDITPALARAMIGREHGFLRLAAG